MGLRSGEHAGWSKIWMFLDTKNSWFYFESWICAFLVGKPFIYSQTLTLVALGTTYELPNVASCRLTTADGLKGKSTVLFWQKAPLTITLHPPLSFAENVPSGPFKLSLFSSKNKTWLYLKMSHFSFFLMLLCIRLTLSNVPLLGFWLLNFLLISVPFQF